MTSSKILNLRTYLPVDIQQTLDSRNTFAGWCPVNSRSKEHICRMMSSKLQIQGAHLPDDVQQTPNLGNTFAGWCPVNSGPGTHLPGDVQQTPNLRNMHICQMSSKLWTKGTQLPDQSPDLKEHAGWCPPNSWLKEHICQVMFKLTPTLRNTFGRWCPANSVPKGTHLPDDVQQTPDPEHIWQHTPNLRNIFARCPANSGPKEHICRMMSSKLPT